MSSAPLEPPIAPLPTPRRSVRSTVETIGSRHWRALAGAAGVLVLAVVVADTLPHVAPGGVLVEGAEFGAVNGLLAVGLVLTYRASRIVNFAYGAMGSAAATVAVELYLVDHVNWIACIVLGVVFGAVIGAGVDLVMRRFFNAPRLVVTVATIGLAQGIGGLQLLVPGWLGGPTLIGGFSTSLSKAHVELFPVLFTGNDLLIAVVVPLVLVGLGWFLLRTDAGVAVRSVADNVERALLLGVPVKRLTTVVWVLAGALAALTTVVSAPSQGLTLSAAAGPELLLPALAAAVVARLHSLPRAFLAGVGLGVVTAIVQFNVSQQSASDVVFLVVILVALLLQRRRSARADDAEESWASTGVLRPIPSQLRRLPEVLTARVTVAVVVLVLLVGAPWVVGPGIQLELAVAVIFGIVAVSLVVLSGWAGTISLGQFAFAGVGGVVAGDLIEKANVDLFVCLVAAGACGAVLAVIVGLPALRIRGLFLAVTTLALAVAVDSFFLNPTNFSNEIPQSFLRPVLWDRFDLASGRAFYYLCLGVLAVAVAFVAGLRQARAGRVLLATRDNEKAAGAMAVPTVRVKLVGFVLAGVLAGVGGALYAVGLRAVGLHTYDPSLSLLVFSMAVIGGLGSIGGSLLGVALIELLSDAFPTYQLEFAGFGMLVLLFVLPGGLGSALQQSRDALLRLVARRRGLVVPSLLADRRTQPGADLEEPSPDLEEPSPDRRTGPSPDLAQPSPAPVVDEALAPLRAGAPEAGARALLSCRGVEIAYGQVQVLFGVDLDVEAGEIVALLGTNGAGKSTLLKGVSGLARIGSGQVTFDGRRLTNATPHAVAHHGIRLMPGGRGVFPSLTVDENLRLGAWMVRRDHHLLREGRRQALALFPVLGTRLGQQAGNLSGGEQQMLSLAMALMVTPRVLLLDELSLGLAPTVVAQLLEVVRMLHRQGTTIVVVEQSVNVALEIAERAVFLEKGEVRFSGPTADLLARPDVLRSVFIAGAASLQDASAVAQAPDERDLDSQGGGATATNGATATHGSADGLAATHGATATHHGTDGLAAPNGATATHHGTDGLAATQSAPDGLAATKGPIGTDSLAATNGEAAAGGRARAMSVGALGGTSMRTGADGRDLEPSPWSGPAVLQVRGASKRFGGITALSGVDLTVHDGEIVGLIGHNGAGKTTLMDVISGFLALDSGRIVLGGVDIGAWPPHERAAAGLGRTFQEAKLFPSLTVAETIAVACERHLASRDMIAAGMRLPASSVSEEAVTHRVTELVGDMGLGAYAEKLIGELSTGTRRIVELACVLAQDPAVLLLDEPSGGVAQRETEALGPMLRHVQQVSGCAMLVIEHDMALLRGLCDQMVAMELGRVIARGTPDEVLEHPQVVASYLGTDSATVNRSGALAAR